MAKSINQVILMGRLTRDPEQRTTSTGKIIANFSIAVDRPTQDDSADFFNVTAWEKLAELSERFLKKGKVVALSGTLQTRSWEKEGVKQYRTEVVARDITFMDNGSGDKKSGTAPTRQAAAQPTRQQSTPQTRAEADPFADDGDDIPF